MAPILSLCPTYEGKVTALPVHRPRIWDTYVSRVPRLVQAYESGIV